MRTWLLGSGGWKKGWEAAMVAEKRNSRSGGRVNHCGRGRVPARARADADVDTRPAAAAAAAAAATE